MDTALSLTLLVSEMLKIPRAKVEPHFLKKLSFITNKCLAQDAVRECPMTTESLWKMHSSTRIFSCILQSYSSKWAISVTEMHITQYKQSLKIIYMMHLLTPKN